MWRLLFEGQITQEGLKEYMIPEYLFYNDYEHENENLGVDISDSASLGRGWKGYKPNLSETELKQMKRRCG